MTAPGGYTRHTEVFGTASRVNAVRGYGHCLIRGLPPSYHAAKDAAERGNAEARDWTRDLDQADAQRRAMCARLLDTSANLWADEERELASDFEMEQRSGERWSLLATAIEGQPTYINGRLLRQDWAAAPHKAGEQLATCGSACLVTRTAGKHGTVPIRCKGGHCPICVAFKGKKRARTLEGQVKHLVAVGCQVLHLTFTMPNDWQAGPALPVALTERERPWYADAPGSDHDDPLAMDMGDVDPGDDDDVWGTVWGAGLATQLEHFREAFGKLRRDRRGRRLWRDQAEAYCYGIEATGRRGLLNPKSAPWVPRWHVHGHVVVVLPPHICPDEWWRKVRAHWLHHVPAAAEQHQHMRRVEPSSVYEVMKYPFKPMELTVGQTIEAVAALKGRNLHYVGGSFHATSTVGRLVRETDGMTEGQATAVLAEVLPARRVPLALALRRARAEVAVESQVGWLYAPIDPTGYRANDGITGPWSGWGHQWQPVTIGFLMEQKAGVTLRTRTGETWSDQYEGDTAAILAELFAWQPTVLQPGTPPSDGEPAPP